MLTRPEEYSGHVHKTHAHMRAPFWKMQAKAYVDDDVVCEAEVTAMVTEEKTEARQ